jgi:hypothetical protein
VRENRIKYVQIKTKQKKRNTKQQQQMPIDISSLLRKRMDSPALGLSLAVYFVSG